MGVNTSDLWLCILLPWTLNLLVLQRFYSKAEDEARTFWFQAILAWFVLLGFTLGPSLHWTNENENSLDSVLWVLEKSWDTVYDALVHVLRYIIPFAVYPLIMFWLKIWVHRTQNKQEQAWWAPQLDTRNVKQQRQQSQLITFVLKVLVLVFVFFDLLGKLGIQTDKVLQIGTVFSLGLSWSMRDWLSSLWASFMISFTTELTCDSIIAVGTNSNAGVQDMLRVYRPGLIYTVCTKRVAPAGLTPKAQSQAEMLQAMASTRGAGRSADWYNQPLQLIYIPNSSLVTQGFVVLHTPN